MTKLQKEVHVLVGWYLFIVLGIMFYLAFFKDCPFYWWIIFIVGQFIPFVIGYFFGDVESKTFTKEMQNDENIESNR